MSPDAVNEPVLPLDAISTPAYVCDETLLEKNLKLLASVRRETGCKVLLAQKGFSMFSLYPLVRQYLDGTTSSGLFEAKLAHEEFGKEIHVYSPAYTDDEFAELLLIADHISFNSFSQWKRFRGQAASAPRPISCGLRINPQHSETSVAIYDPCAPFSRLGIPVDSFEWDEIEGIDGLHMHTLCEKNADALVRTVTTAEKTFGDLFKQVSWVNFGGGHLITRPDYDVTLLCEFIVDFQKKYDVQVILEPGQAVGLNTGYLVASVVDVFKNGMDIAILDTSATAHMPDVLEMPYRPQIAGAGKPGQYPYTYRLGGQTCLAGDVIGDYSFQQPLKVGHKLVFMDMIHYTMVKNTTFNGIPLPDIGVLDADKNYRIVRRFGYQDFKTRLS